MTKGEKILIAEDEKSIAGVMELKLSHEGFEVAVAYNGEDAINQAKSGHFDLILLDLIMPKKDGFAVLKELQENNITTPVFVLSNLSQQEDEKRTKELGAKEFFIKSNTPLTKIVERVQQEFN